MIVRVSAENFLPFRESVEFPLENQGLVLIRGNNRVSASSNDNGSGKTSVVHALCWGLFGEDLKGRKADAVANRFTDETCRVIVNLRDDNGEWSIVRTRRPGRLLVEGSNLPEDSDATVVQAYIESRLGFGLRTFKNAVVFGQGAFERFAHADQGEQIKMLDEIQGLDFTTPLNLAKNWKSQLAATMGEIENGMRSDSDNLIGAQSEIKTLTALRNTHERTVSETVKGLKARMFAATEAIKRAETETKALEADARTLARARKEENVLIEKEAAMSLTRQAEDEAGALQDEAGTNLRHFDEKLTRLLEHSECPTCRSLVDRITVPKRFMPERGSLAADAERTAQAYRKCLAASAAALDAVEAQQRVLRAIVGGTEDLSRMIMRLEERCTPVARKRLGQAEEQARREALAMSIEVKKAEGQKWDGQAALDKAEATAVALTVRIAREQGRLDKAAIAVDVASYCVEAFGDRGIRSIIVDGIADYVNDRMQDHLETLTAGEATNVMSAQTTLKSGKMKERISFTPTWTWGGEGAGTGSDGQDRRVDLATFASMQDLAESRSAKPFPLKAYDEPFDALDTRGKEMACAWLREQAKERTVILITHSEELAGLANPDKIWTIDHDANGARLLLS